MDTDQEALNIIKQQIEDSMDDLATWQARYRALTGRDYKPPLRLARKLASNEELNPLPPPNGRGQ